MRPSEVNMANMSGGIEFDKPMFQLGGKPQTNAQDNNEGRIVFAPQIVVTTGNDNNMTIPSSQNQEPLQSTNDIPFTNSVIRNVSMDQMEPVKSRSIEISEPKPVEPEVSGGGGGGLLDFAKGFFIKKMT
jgi:hypothetical protein